MTETDKLNQDGNNGYVRRKVITLVQEDLWRRSEIGTRKYGEPLRTFNGRSALQDAYEEALDLAMYLKQAIIEKKSIDKENGVEGMEGMKCCDDSSDHYHSYSCGREYGE